MSNKNLDFDQSKVFNGTHQVIEGLAREEFPILYQTDHGLKDMVYLNSATTTHKPKHVLNALMDYYKYHNFSVYRGSGSFHSQRSTNMYEEARKKVSDFINSSSSSQILFTSGATESINFVAQTWGSRKLNKDDVILLPVSEHNSNLLPWFVLRDRVGCKLEYIKLLKSGQLDLEHLEFLLKNKKPKLLCCGHASNVLGVIQNVKKIAKMAHEHGCFVLVDAAQTVGKITVDVQDMDVDFLAGSGHKMYAPTGIGFLYYKKQHLESLDPQKCGGGTVKDVTFDSCDYFDVPFRFEAGTPPVAQAIGLGAAIDFLNSVGMDKIRSHDVDLLKYLYHKMKDLVNLYDFDPALERVGVIPFNVDGVDPFDLSSMLASKNIITRSGKHCAYLLHKSYYYTNTIRVSLAMYNSSHDVDRFIEVLKECIALLKNQK